MPGVICGGTRHIQVPDGRREGSNTISSGPGGGQLRQHPFRVSVSWCQQQKSHRSTQGEQKLDMERGSCCHPPPIDELGHGVALIVHVSRHIPLTLFQRDLVSFQHNFGLGPWPSPGNMVVVTRTSCSRRGRRLPVQKGYVDYCRRSRFPFRRMPTRPVTRACSCRREVQDVLEPYRM